MAGARPVTRWRRWTCASTTCTSSAASTCRATSPTRRPARLFDGLLATSGEWEQTDWYEVVAPEELRALYDACRRATGLTRLPDDLGALSHRGSPAPAARPAGTLVPARRARDAYRELCARVSTVSAQRWLPATWTRAAAPPNAWCGGCCASATRPTSCSAPTPAGRCACGWRARGTGARPTVSISSTSPPPPRANPRSTGPPLTPSAPPSRRESVRGHVEVRWSHGRFVQPPEAKVYLDTPSDELPGYFALEPGASQPELWD